MPRLLQFRLLSNHRFTPRRPSDWHNPHRASGLNNNFHNLIGTIPTELGRLTVSSQLRLYYNNLSGNIPTELGQMAELFTLHVGDNHLVGNIPTELGQLSANLGELYLHANYGLIGNIPTELGLLSLVQTMYVYCSCG